MSAENPLWGSRFVSSATTPAGPLALLVCLGLIWPCIGCSSDDGPRDATADISGDLPDSFDEATDLPLQDSDDVLDSALEQGDLPVDALPDASDAGPDSADTLTDTAHDLDVTSDDVDQAEDGLPDIEPVPCISGLPADRTPTLVEDDVFLKGPYLQQVTESSMVIMWESVSVGTGIVEYGTTDALGSVASETAPGSIHEIMLEGLQDDTRYAYRVELGGTQSEIHHFWTAPEPGTPIRFTVWGDSQEHPDVAQGVVEDMLPFEPYLVMHVGDTLSNGNLGEQWQSQVFDPIRDLAHEVPFFAAMGNHEANSHYYYDYHSYPHPADDPGHESFYSFLYGNVFFLVIDTNKLFSPILTYEPPQYLFIKEALSSPEARSARWRVVFGHEPAYSESWSPGDCDYQGNYAVRDYLFPVLRDFGVSAYFSGHTHDYERGMVDGMLYFITGGGGGGLDEWCRDWEETTVVAYVHHHIRVEATCDALVIEAVDIDNQIIDQFTFTGTDYE